MFTLSETRKSARSNTRRTGALSLQSIYLENPKASHRKKTGDDDLVRWLTSKDNPYFAKAVANRIWSYFFGRGIIDPVDDIRAGNPPSNEPLLAALTKDLDGSQLSICSTSSARSSTRGLTSSRYRTNEWNQDDEANFSHALPRRLPAETLFDAISVATGSTLKFKDVPQNFRAQQFPDPTVGWEASSIFLAGLSAIRLANANGGAMSACRKRST